MLARPESGFRPHLGGAMPSAVAKTVGAASVFIAVAIAASASGSVPAAPASAQGETDEWQSLAIRSITQGSTTGSPAAPAATVEPVVAAPPSESAAGPIRLTGLAGTNLNQAMEKAGVPNAVAQDYLRALATEIRLTDGISVKDRFDLVILQDQLVYAGLDRVGASDVQLMRWAFEGKTGWVDATGTTAQEAMRMPVSGGVSSSFGMRYHPILRQQRFHRGVDLKAAQGTPIRAPADGRVTYAGWNGGYGRQVRIGHGEGLATSFSHMSRIAAAPGQAVRRGDVIGFVGSSGMSTGPHLHYEVFKGGKQVNPMSIRAVGSGDALDREERRALNSTLRALLMAGRSG